MCGLFGFNGNPSVMNETMARLVMNKIKILGLYNIDRGKHSCGVYMNNRVIKGVNDEKIFSDFIAKFLLPNAMETGNYNVIGHTRAATVGAHSADNAHPFTIDDNFVLAHNGQVKNIWQLCNKHGVNHNGVVVDSHGLAHLVNKVGFSILEQYEGWAALLMAHKDRPNSLYVYKGASKVLTNGDPVVERPLFYLNTQEGIYLSSIEKSLFAISDYDSDAIGEVPQNVVIRLQDGLMTNDRHFIERGNINVSYVHSPNTGGTTRTGTSNTTRTNMTTRTPTGAAHGTNSSIGNSYSGGSLAPDLDKIIPVTWWETLPQRAGRYRFSTGVIYHQGRYWLVDNDAITPMHGAYYINSKGKVLLERKQGYNYYFIEGILMKNKANYETAKLDPNLAHPDWNFAMYISRYAEYPVCHTRNDVNTRCKEVPAYSKYRWYQNEVMCQNTGFTPKFSDRHYTIKDGLMHKIKNAKGNIAEDEEMIDTLALINERKSLWQASPLSVAIQHPQMRIIKGGEEMDDAVQQTIDDMKLAFAKKERERAIANELPFEATCVVNELDPKNFYRKFATIDEANELFSNEERRAIRYYIADVLNESGIVQIINVYDEAIDVQLNLFFAECIENDITVIDNWNEKDYKDVLTYLLIARENPDGSVYDEDDLHEIDEDAVEDCCCNFPHIPKPIMMAPNINADIELPEGWTCTEEGVVADPKDDQEPHPMEIEMGKEREKFLAVMQVEQAEIPTVEAEEVFEGEVYQPVPIIGNAFDDDKEDRNYSFGEIVNYANRAREEADELQAMEDDDFAQEVASKVYIAVDSLTASLLELTEKHKEVELRKDIILYIKQRS